MTAVTLEERKLVVRKVLSVLRSGAFIISGVTEDGKALRVVCRPKALARIPIPGESWSVTGEMRVSSEHGEQLHAVGGKLELPRGRLITQFLANHPDFVGIGDTKAQRLWEKFGERLLPTLAAGDIDELEAVLTRPAATRLVEAWATKQTEVETIEFLDLNGLDLRIANQVLQAWGTHAIKMLRLNPYLLLAFTSWPEVDAAAQKLGVAKDDTRRLVGAVEATLYERLEQAHTLTSHKLLVDRIVGYMPVGEARRAVVLAAEEFAICGNEQMGYQAFGAAALESSIAGRITAILAGETAEQTSLRLVFDGTQWAACHIESMERRQGFPFNEEQRLAAVLPFEHSFSILTGGAGVGKTTALRTIIELAHRQGLAVVQMALAGRAAQRTAEVTDQPAMTIAKFLAATRAGKLDVLPHTLVVIDEAAMLDLPTLYRILKSLPNGVRVLLVGDPAQLPPNGFGLAFHRLVGNPRVPQVHLVKVHRHGAASGIPDVATDVRQHLVPSFVPFTGLHSGVSFVACAPDAVMQKLRRLREVWQGEDWQVLSAVKGGKAGVRNINENFHTDACERASTHTATLILGEPVIHLINDYELGLMTGALGKVVALVEGGGLEIEFDGERHSFSAAALPERIELAYAISVHNSQGSQFKRVAVVVGRSRLLDHALIYTGLTRGVEQVVFLGDLESFENAIRSAPLAHTRCVAFSV